MMKEVSYRDLMFNPFNLFAKEWFILSAGNEQHGINGMTISWGQLGCLWGQNDPVAVVYVRPQRHTKKFMDNEEFFTMSVLPKALGKVKAYFGTASGKNEDKIAKSGLTPVFENGTVYYKEAKLVFVCRKMYEQELEEKGFFYPDTVPANYPAKDFHTVYVGRIEKVLVQDDEYLK